MGLPTIISRRFERTITAVCHAIMDEHHPQDVRGASLAVDDVGRFVLSQHAGMPDALRAPFVALTIGLGASTVLRHGRSFHRLSHAARRQQIGKWRDSPIGPCRDFVRFIEGFTVLYWYSEKSSSSGIQVN